MVDGNKLGDVGFQYLGVPYSQMDCQAFVEKCLSDCGLKKDLAGSNAWFREVYKNGAILTPEECVKQLGCVPKGAFLFILEHDGKEPEKYKPDGLGNASHIGLCTIPRGEGAIHSSASRDVLQNPSLSKSPSMVVGTGLVCGIKYHMIMVEVVVEVGTHPLQNRLIKKLPLLEMLIREKDRM